MRISLRWRRKNLPRLLRISLWCFTLSSLVLFFIFPIIFKYSSYLQTHFIFENDAYYPSRTNFSNPASENLEGALNRFIPSKDGIVLGVWQILPITVASVMAPLLEHEKYDWFLKRLGNGNPIFLYCHGNKPSRATHHRVLLYQVLQKMDFHVVTFDFRGFADSSPVDPTEDGVVEDALQIVSWIRNNSLSPLFIWGHSLGTGIATKAAVQLCKQHMCPDAVFLQSPFTSISSMFRTATLTIPFRILPWFDFMFLSPLADQGLIFDTEKNILSVDCPLLILHAEDDAVVPFSMGKHLYNIAHSAGKVVKFISFEKESGYGHNYICKSERLPSIIKDFLREISAKL